MIFNESEIANKLYEIIYKCGHVLNNEDLQMLKVIQMYFATTSHKITYDEFKELFDCKKVFKDINTIEIKVCPKKEIYCYINDDVRAYCSKLGIEINHEIEEQIDMLAYQQFIKQLSELRSTL